MTEIEAKEALVAATLRYEREKRHVRESLAQERNAYRELTNARAIYIMLRSTRD